MLQNLKLDLLKLRSSGIGSAIEDETSATQEARALSRDIGHVLEAAEDLKKHPLSGVPSCVSAAEQRAAIASATCRGASSGVKWRAPGITSSVAPGIACWRRFADRQRNRRDPAVPTRSPWARRSPSSSPRASRVSSRGQRADVRDERVATVGVRRTGAGRDRSSARRARGSP